MQSKIEKQDRVRVRLPSMQSQGLAGTVIDVRGNDTLVVLIDGADEGVLFRRSEVQPLLPSYQVGDWIEFPDVGGTRSRGPILEISNNFASVGRYDIDSGKYIAHWNTYLYGHGVCKVEKPALSAEASMTKLQQPVRIAGVKFVELPPGYEGAQLAFLRTDRVLLVHPDKPILLFDTVAHRWTELVPQWPAQAQQNG